MFHTFKQVTDPASALHQQGCTACDPVSFVLGAARFWSCQLVQQSCSPSLVTLLHREKVLFILAMDSSPSEINWKPSSSCNAPFSLSCEGRESDRSPFLQEGSASRSVYDRTRKTILSPEDGQGCKSSHHGECGHPTRSIVSARVSEAIFKRVYVHQWTHHRHMPLIPRRCVDKSRRSSSGIENHFMMTDVAKLQGPHQRVTKESGEARTQGSPAGYRGHCAGGAVGPGSAAPSGAARSSIACRACAGHCMLCFGISIAAINGSGMLSLECTIERLLAHGCL